MNVVWRSGGLPLAPCVSEHMPVLFLSPSPCVPMHCCFLEGKKKTARRMQRETISELSPDSVCSVREELSLSLWQPVFFWVCVFPFPPASHIWSLFCGAISCRLTYISNNLPSVKLKIDLISGPAPLLLGFSPDEVKPVCGRDICTDMLTVAPLLAKIAKHGTYLNVYEGAGGAPKCAVYTGKYYIGLKTKMHLLSCG